MAYNNRAPEHAFKKFNDDIKNNSLSNVMLFYGEEDYLIKWASDSVINNFVSKEAKSMDFVKLNDNATINEIIDSCEMFSMFLGNRVVYVKDFIPLYNEKAKGYGIDVVNSLCEYIKYSNKSTYLIFSINEVNEKGALFNTISEVGKVYNFTKLDESTLSSFAVKQFKSNGINIDKGNLKYFIDQTGYFNKESEYRIFNLINDISKISFLSNGAITKEIIDQVLVGDMDTFIFNFTDALSNNRKDLAFEMLHSILKEKDIYNVLNVIISHFELLLEVLEFKKQALSLNEMVKKLKIHEFRIKKALSACDKFSVPDLKKLLLKAYEIDRNIKNGLLDGEIALELIIASI